MANPKMIDSRYTIGFVLSVSIVCGLWFVAARRMPGINDDRLQNAVLLHSPNTVSTQSILAGETGIIRFNLRNNTAKPVRLESLEINLSWAVLNQSEGSMLPRVLAANATWEFEISATPPPDIFGVYHLICDLMIASEGMPDVSKFNVPISVVASVSPEEYSVSMGEIPGGGDPQFQRVAVWTPATGQRSDALNREPVFMSAVSDDPSLTVRFVRQERRANERMYIGDLVFTVVPNHMETKLSSEVRVKFDCREFRVKVYGWKAK